MPESKKLNNEPSSADTVARLSLRIADLESERDELVEVLALTSDFGCSQQESDRIKEVLARYED